MSRLGFFWIQERVAARLFSIVKVGTDRDVSDILTKSSTAVVLEKHLKTLRVVSVERSPVHKSVLKGA